MYQLKPFKHYIYYRENNQLDGINTERQISDNNNNALSTYNFTTVKKKQNNIRI